MHFPINYQNGNYSVEILSDGTKIRTLPELDPVFPEFPESIDIKITNYCDLSKICTYCHEQSNLSGKDAMFDNLLTLLKSCPKGMEWAIGGGNPLTYPNLKEILRELNRNNIIANLTVNQLHLKKYEKLIKELIEGKLVKGLGISLRSLGNLPEWPQTYSNTVYHIIAGIDQIEKIEKFPKPKNGKLKILILGYKNYGNGKIHLAQYESKISDNLRSWQMYLPKLFQENIILSFDNLAIEQLKLRRFFPDSEWEKFYMGDDGKYTCYIDMVEEKFAKSSTSEEKFDIIKFDIREIFNKIMQTSK